MTQRYTKEEQLNLIAEQEKSGLSRHDFCQNKNINRSQFSCWLSRNKKHVQKNKSHFVPVQVVPSVKVSQIQKEFHFPSSISIQIRNLIKIDVTENVSPQWLAQVLNGVKR